MGRRRLAAAFGVGTTVVGTAHILKCRQEYNETRPPVTLTKYLLLRSLPVRSMSAAAGCVSELFIPKFLRSPVYKLYSAVFGVNLTECAALDSFPTFQSFFTRPLLPDSRVVDKRALIVSPCDGVVTSSGRVEDIDGRFEAVKGVYYNLKDFLGEKTKDFTSPSGWLWSSPSIYYVTIYLAPGDYHRFHSPANLTIEHCEVQDGMKLPVFPWFLRWTPQVLRLNTRACIIGDGVAVIPVGALNVSSIDVMAKEGDRVNKGDLLGQFKMGSTIVLLFKTNKSVDIPNGPIKMGERIL